MQLVYQKSSEEAYAELITNNSKSFLIDVRSRQEWADTGIPQISLDREKVILCEWRIKPTMEFNENFFYELNGKLDFDQVENLYFICAAGVRSREAAVYTKDKFQELDLEINCINIIDGFNGNSIGFLNFRKANGWKASGLPHCNLNQPA